MKLGTLAQPTGSKVGSEIWITKTWFAYKHRPKCLIRRLVSQVVTVVASELFPTLSLSVRLTLWL